VLLATSSCSCSCSVQRARTRSNGRRECGVHCDAALCIVHCALQCMHLIFAFQAPCGCGGSRQDPMATPGNFGGGSTDPGQGFLRTTDNGQRGRRQAFRGGGAPRTLCGKSRTPGHKAQSTRGRQERLAVEVFLFGNPNPIGDIPVSPNNFQREETGALFGSGWAYCASRRCWES
jgi:hypothetical protein